MHVVHLSIDPAVRQLQVQTIPTFELLHGADNLTAGAQHQGKPPLQQTLWREGLQQNALLLKVLPPLLDQLLRMQSLQPLPLPLQPKLCLLEAVPQRLAQQEAPLA